MFHQSRKTARATMGAAIGLLALLFLLAACGSISPKLLSNSLQGAQSVPNLLSPNDAGYIATSPGTYTAAEVTFTVPTFQQPAGGPKVAYAAVVAGHSGAVVDGGIYSYLDPTTGAQINKAYWEFYGPGSGLSVTEDLPLSGGTGGGVVSPGDQIDAYVSSNYQGSGDDYFLIQDLTTGESGSYTLSGNDYIVDGANASCLVLVPATDPQPPADFGTLNVQQCQVSLSEGTGASTTSTISNYKPVPITMVNGGFGASPGPLGKGGDFSVTWNAQPQGN